MYRYKFIGYLKTNEDVEFWYNSQEVMPWRLSYRNAGRYFASVEALTGYCYGRRWINGYQVDLLADQLEANANSILIYEPKPRYKRNYRR